MADCMRCGTKAGMGKALCGSCAPIVEAEREEQRKASIAHERELALQQRNERREREEQETREREAR